MRHNINFVSEQKFFSKMKRYIFALLLLLLAANATAEGKVGVRVKIEDTAALEKGEATDVRLYCYYKPQMSPPKLEFSGSVHYLGEKKVNGEYVYHYRISPRSTGSLALNFQFYNDEAAETLARVDVWETKRPGGTEVAMPESPYAAGAKGMKGIEGIGEPGIGSRPSDLPSKIFSLTLLVMSILFLIKKLVRGAEKKILHAYYRMASPLLRKEAYGNAPDYSRLLERSPTAAPSCRCGRKPSTISLISPSPWRGSLEKFSSGNPSYSSMCFFPATSCR